MTPSESHLYLFLMKGTMKHRFTPALPKHPGHLNDRRCNISSTEAGVLTAYHQATARPLPKEVRTITGGEFQSSYPQGKRVPVYLSGSNFFVYSRCPLMSGSTI
ncbi:hypothetical protein AVEN_54866-1 [Araneus ventricosus]|uniref:Uncharacterized protein n=1 Tax=Araneus ventricosus TaxID=182803 RepID=A0A4Y2LCQ9_ARAVE|nr:hypothetical protein AVEN_19340-1 [Araneus ventricosus]GBN13918.1 hypothetical protein AVEN_54866-1 [Araneus ventricosus]